jgi:mRNA interferase RelE/StbE
MKYHIEITTSAERALKKVEQKYSKKVNERINRLRDDPRHHGSIKMSGYEHTYRTRVGKYRIVYEIYDKKVLVVVVNVDQRKDIYQ